MAYDTGMRRGEILHLRWKQVDLKGRRILLQAKETKSSRPRFIILTDRVVDALSSMRRHTGCPYVFVSRRTGQRRQDIRKQFIGACDKVGIKATGKDGLWFHDLRRSFVTNARRRGVPESVVMKMSGHRTRSVFDRYNIVNEDDVREAVKQIETGRSRELGQSEDKKTTDE